MWLGILNLLAPHWKLIESLVEQISIIRGSHWLEGHKWYHGAGGFMIKSLTPRFIYRDCEEYMKINVIYALWIKLFWHVQVD